MRKGLSRTRTRISILLIVLAAAAILLGAVRSGWIPTLAGVVLLIIAALVIPRKCPVCGKNVALKPQWSEPGSSICPYCRSRLAYDDEEQEQE